MKRSNGEALLVRGRMVFKELHDPKDLAQRIETIKMRYFKLRVVRVGRGRSCLWYRKQRSWGLWMGFDVGNFLEKLIELVGHGCLSGGKGQLVGGEFGNGLLNSVHIGLRTSRFGHDTQ